MDKVYLRAGRERSVERRHPWIFSGAVERVEDGGVSLAVWSSTGDPAATLERREMRNEVRNVEGPCFM